jgi:hypothetical protein
VVAETIKNNKNAQEKNLRLPEGFFILQTVNNDSIFLLTLIIKSIRMLFKNAISWFEIPASDLNRAQSFMKPFSIQNLIPWICRT